MSSCKNENNNDSFTLKGEIGDWDSPATLYFSYWNDGNEVTDTTQLKNGKFSFSGNIGEPAAARLIMDYTGVGMGPAAQAGHILYLYLENMLLSAHLFSFAIPF